MPNIHIREIAYACHQQDFRQAVYAALNYFSSMPLASDDGEFVRISMVQLLGPNVIDIEPILELNCEADNNAVVDTVSVA